MTNPSSDKARYPLNNIRQCLSYIDGLYPSFMQDGVIPSNAKEVLCDMGIPLKDRINLCRQWQLEIESYIQKGMINNREWELEQQREKNTQLKKDVQDRDRIIGEKMVDQSKAELSTDGASIREQVGGELTKTEQAELAIVKGWAVANRNNTLQSDYCVQNGISVRTLRNWNKKFQARRFDTEWPER